MSIALKTNEWNSLKVQFRELVRDESLRGELEKFFDDEIRRRFGMAISGAVEAAEIEESRSLGRRVRCKNPHSDADGFLLWPVQHAGFAIGSSEWLGPLARRSRRSRR